MNKKLFTWLPMAFVLMLLSACTGLQRDYQDPEIYLTKIMPMAGSGLEQRFLIGLRIVNPNRSNINISGMSYSINIRGQKLISGVSSHIPRIPGYGEAEVELEAATNLLGAVQLAADMMRNPAKAIDYELEARLDVGRFAVPVRIKETGSINLGQQGLLQQQSQ
ncbi:MAG: LEA type 2 family protein [Porticoccaceae bacterium]|nr:LEA type 2 family protein [Porticoccaceae bacterium]